MVEVELSLKRLIKIWWSLIWRFLLFISLTGGISGFISSFFVGHITNNNKDTIISLFMILGVFACIPVGIWIVKNVIKKRFSDFRIALIEK